MAKNRWAYNYWPAKKRCSKWLFSLIIAVSILRSAEKTELGASANAANSFEKPQTVLPVTSPIKVSETFGNVLPTMSLTVIRIKTK